MNKHLLLGCALVAAISVYPQLKNSTANGIAKEPIQLYMVEKESTPSTNGDASLTKPVVTPPKKNNNLGIAAVTAQRISGSHNCFGVLVSEQRPLSYNPALNAVCFVHRASITYTTGITGGNSGTQAAWLSTNSGATWDSTCIWVDASNLARYPQGGIYNFPSTNTNMSNAYVIGMGPITNGTGWIGNWYASKVLGTYNKIPTDMKAKLNATAVASLNVHQFSRISFNSTDDGLVRGIATIMNDPAGTSYLAQGTRGAGIVKGVFAAGAFNWSMDSIIPVTGTRTDGSKLLDFAPVMAFNNAGTIGYCVFYGVTSATTNASQCGFQPIVYKTTNSGATWSQLPAVTWTTPAFSRLVSNLWTTSSNTNVVIPRFTSQEGHGAVVDVNNNLHLVTTVRALPINHPDSLDYYTPWTTANYQWPEQKGGWPYIYDFHTTAANTWRGILVDSMYTEGPSGTSGQPGYTENSWVDPNTSAGAKIDLDARLQVGRSDDGKQIFYSWTETDTSATNHHWNIFPDIKAKAWDVTVDKMTPRYNVSGGTGLRTDQLAYFHYMSNKGIRTNICGSHEIPFTASNNLPKDGGQPVDHFYFKGFVIPCADYTIASVPLGVEEKADAKTTTSSFDVNIYPNPASDAVATISVNLKEAKTFEITVYNAIGQQIQSIKLNGKAGSNEIDLDITKFNSGVYLYSVKVDNAVTTKKLIVE